MRLKLPPAFIGPGYAYVFLGLAIIVCVIGICQLIFWSSFIIDISPRSRDFERVQLPLATEAVEDKEPPDKLSIAIIHEMPQGEECPQLRYERGGIVKQVCQIKEHWKTKIKSKAVSMEELQKKLWIYGNADRKGGPGSKTISNLSVIIRADASAPYELARQILEACARAGIWKTEFGAAKPME